MILLFLAVLAPDEMASRKSTRDWPIRTTHRGTGDPAFRQTRGSSQLSTATPNPPKTNRPRVVRAIASGNWKLMALYGVTDWSKLGPAEASRDGNVCAPKHSFAVQTQQFETLSVANWLHVPAHDDTLSTPRSRHSSPRKRCPRRGLMAGAKGKAGRIPPFRLFTCIADACMRPYR
jgi:hypothetical protein